jgi:DMSO/TMAO reductase YedYZ molybdopterin-dependent catalytic subunit
MRTGLYESERPLDAPSARGGRRAARPAADPGGRRPAWCGVLAGLVAAFAGLAAAELVVGLVRGSASPVVPVGQEVIDRVPVAVKDWAIDTFGTADKAVLVAGSLLTLLLIGSLVGVLAVRGQFGSAVAVTAAVGVVGVMAALSRPAPTLGKLLPSIVGTVVSVVVLWWLTARRSSTASPPGDDGAAVPTVVRDGDDRRSFLMRSAAVGASSLAIGWLGRRLQERFEIEDEREELALPEPDDAASAVPVGADLGIDGITPFVTPADDFYRIDTALRVPQVRRASWRLRIHGMVDREMTLDFDDLLAREQVERFVTLSCVSNDVGGDLVGNARWQGVLLADVLRDAGVQGGAEQLVSRSVDGWTCGTPVAAVLDGRDAMLAVAMNGEPLPAEHGYPVRMVVPGLYGYVSATKWVNDIELTTWDAFDAYWVPRGWAKEAPVKTMTRIDRPRRDIDVAGPYEIGGVAWAVHRGISAVQVRIDDGAWIECELAAVPSDDTWRQWLHRWDATPGRHTIEARAVDGAGEVQPEERAAPAPNGAQGYHRVTVDVA